MTKLSDCTAEKSIIVVPAWVMGLVACISRLLRDCRTRSVEGLNGNLSAGRLRGC